MRLLFLLMLILGGNVFGQSKKELRIALEKSTVKIDSLQSILTSERLASQQKSDSLQAVIDDTQKRLNEQYLLTKTQDESIAKCTSRNYELRKENQRLKEAASNPKNPSSSKVSKNGSNPFLSGSGYGGGGNGSPFQLGEDGHIGKGTGSGKP